MKLRNTAIALGVAAATAAGLSLLKVEKPIVINSTAAVLVGGLLLSARKGGKSGTVKGPLVGSELLKKVKELGDVSKSDLVRKCGYVSRKKSGGERLNFTAFYEALLEAKGVNLASESAGGIGKGGRKLSYVATVQGNGNLLIGKAYTALLDLKPGDNFEIKMGRKGFRLVPEGDG